MVTENQDNDLMEEIEEVEPSKLDPKNVLPRDRIREIYQEHHPGKDPQYIDAITAEFVDSVYGGAEKHAELLARKDDYDVVVEQEYSDTAREIDSLIQNTESYIDQGALLDIERRQAHYISQGKSERAARSLAMVEAAAERGESAILGSVDAQIRFLSEHGYSDILDSQEAVKMVADALGATVGEAYARVVRENYRRDTEEADRFENEFGLSPEEMRQVEILQDAQPDAKWTAEKYYKMIKADPQPRKKMPARAEVDYEPSETGSDQLERELKVLKAAQPGAKWDKEKYHKRLKGTQAERRSDILYDEDGDPVAPETVRKLQRENREIAQTVAWLRKQEEERIRAHKQVDQTYNYYFGKAEQDRLKNQIKGANEHVN